MDRDGSSESIEARRSRLQGQSKAMVRNATADKNRVETQAEDLPTAGQHEEPRQEEPDEELTAEEFARYHHSDLQGHPRVKCRGRRIDPALIKQVDSMIVECCTSLGTEEDPFLDPQQPGASRVSCGMEESGNPQPQVQETWQAT